MSTKLIYKQIDAGMLGAIRLGPRLLRVSVAEARRFEEDAKMIPAHARAPAVKQPDARAMRQQRLVKPKQAADPRTTRRPYGA